MNSRSRWRSYLVGRQVLTKLAEQFDVHLKLEDATAGTLADEVWRETGEGSLAGRPDDAGQDWSVVAGERFSRKGAHQGVHPERKID